ncbi:amino acid permease-domain-containing protein [Dactylonectria macrodidyma]|uniref:Amino acid permease-domain-containing protein n=1 Tax=Dactylonectria macrodidyma TaxID=307937 RepID=A0A9P9J1L0_9HYPO|nr:amino acid permease-domain-containing protein [Dactylonectria macrodidyma]
MASSRPDSPLQPNSPKVRAQNGGFWKSQAPLDEQRHAIKGRGALDAFDVFGLIVNKMIGTGIYSAPASVFLMTGDKKLTLGLFGIGFAYTLISMVIYLDYANVLPFNGGELVYLDEIASHVSPQNGIEMRTLTNEGREQSAPTLRPRKWRFGGDGLLVFIIYSISFILFFNSGTNSMQFGRMVLLCITAEKTSKDEDTSEGPPDVNRDLMRFIGVFVLSLICLFQYFSPNFGRSLNKTLAVAKIAMLFGLLIAAGRAATSGLGRSGDWDTTYHVDSKGVSTAKALLLVLFSFKGWENATFVTGEIRRHSVLRNGFISAVVTVGCLYLAIVAAFLHFISWDALDPSFPRNNGSGEGRANTNYAPMLTSNNTRSRQAWAAMSSFGSLNAIIYTFSRVKQAIGHADILPWSRFWKQDDHLLRKQNVPRTRRAQRNREGQTDHSKRAHEFLYKSPQGGLIIHWIMSVALILVTIGIKSTSEAASLPGYIHTYMHCAVLGFLGLGYFRLKSREYALWPIGAATRRPERNLALRWLLYGIIPIYVFVNLAILIVTAIKPYKAVDGSNNSVHGWAFPVIVGTVLVTGTIYYLLFFGAAPRRYEHAALDGDNLPHDAQPPPVAQEGLMRRTNWWNWMRWAGVQCEIRKSYTYDMELERVYRFGRRWKIIYHLPGDPGYQPPGPQPTNPSSSTMFLYWLFGGSRLPDAFKPTKILRRWRADRKRELRNLSASGAIDTSQGHDGRNGVGATS